MSSRHSSRRSDRNCERRFARRRDVRSVDGGWMLPGEWSRRLRHAYFLLSPSPLRQPAVTIPLGPRSSLRPRCDDALFQSHTAFWPESSVWIVQRAIVMPSARL